MMHLVEYYENNQGQTKDAPPETIFCYFYNDWPAEGPPIRKKVAKKEIFYEDLGVEYSETLRFTPKLIEIMKSAFNVAVLDAEHYRFSYKILLLKDISINRFFIYEVIYIGVDYEKYPCWDDSYPNLPLNVSRLKYVDNFSDVFSICGQYAHPLLLEQIEFELAPTITSDSCLDSYFIRE